MDPVVLKVELSAITMILLTTDAPCVVGGVVVRGGVCQSARLSADHEPWGAIGRAWPTSDALRLVVAPDGSPDDAWPRITTIIVERVTAADLADQGDVDELEPASPRAKSAKKRTRAKSEKKRTRAKSTRSNGGST